MIINFRQGIIAAQVNNNYLQLVGGKVNINVDVQRLDIAFAYGTHDYLFTEAEAVVGAWGPFPTGIDTYLYWDIDLATGLRTFGTTPYAPSYGNSLPANPSVGQHFFDYADKKMKVWSGVAWNEKLRVFAGKIGSGGIFTPQPIGSQVALNGQISFGYILFDVNGIALRVVDRSGRYYFLTTEDPVHTQQDIHNAYKIDSILMDGKAIEPIPAYHCLTWKGPKQLGVASYIDYTRPCVGISVEPAGINEVKQFITKGFLTNYNNWNWTQAPNTPLFVGDTGQITVDVPQQYSLQKVGHIVSSDTVFIDLQEIVWIENRIPGPTPSPTPTITPSRSVSLTPSPTPTTSLSPSVTATQSLTPTPTSSLGISPTPTPTHTQTPTVTLSATLTPTPTVTSSTTVTPSPTPTITPSVTTSPTVISNSPDAISLFYKSAFPLTNANDKTAQVALSSFDGATRNDIGQFSVSWRVSSDGEDVGDKFTRKLRGFDNGGFISINPPNFVGTDRNDGNLYWSGIYADNDFEYDSSFAPSITHPVFTIPNNSEGFISISAYAVDITTGLQYGTYRFSTSQNIDSLVVFSNGNQLAVNQLNDFTNSNSTTCVGLHGMDVLGDGTAFMLGVEDETNKLTLIKIGLTNINVEDSSVDVTYTFDVIQSSDTIPLYHLDNLEDTNGEIYESKSFGEKDYISVANNINSRRQDLFLTSQNVIDSNESYVAVYNRATQQLENVIYNANDYGYISITDNYLFVINPVVPPSSLTFGASSDVTTDVPEFCVLNVRSLDSTNNVTDVTSLTLTNQIPQNQFQGMTATDARLRTVKSNANTITIYTFGFGIYVFDIPTQTMNYSGASDIYNDGHVFGLLPSASAYTDVVIDTWAGKLTQ
jgi:hypothetical protein